VVLHQRAAGGSVAEIAGVPLQESVDLAILEFDVVRRIKVVALGAPAVGFRMPAFRTGEYVCCQAVTNLLVVLGKRIHSPSAYYGTSRFVAPALTIEV